MGLRLDPTQMARIRNKADLNDFGRNASSENLNICFTYTRHVIKMFVVARAMYHPDNGTASGSTQRMYSGEYGVG